MVETCPLCEKRQAEVFCKDSSTRAFYRCSNCDLIFIERSQLPGGSSEKARYLTHQNDVNDPRYQKFVEPLVRGIQRDFSPSAFGLDYGCGPGPVVAHQLRRHGYAVDLFDPIFGPTKIQGSEYDFIFCSEVPEHFHYPKKEFDRLLELLKPHDSALYLFTHLYSEAEGAFHDWYYKNDPTHVVFYTEVTAHWLQKHYSFKSLEIQKPRLVCLRSPTT